MSRGAVSPRWQSFSAPKAPQTAIANGDTRTISMHHVHSGEDITITYKKNGRFDDEALKKLNWFLRDWRRNEATTMDPKLIDIVWEVWREVGSDKPVEVIGGYRAPATNNMLRRRSKGVARNSQHTVGHAMDFYIPGAPLEKMRMPACGYSAAASATIRAPARRSSISTPAACATGRA